MFSFVLALLAFLLFYDSFTVLMGWGVGILFLLFLLYCGVVRGQGGCEQGPVSYTEWRQIPIRSLKEKTPSLIYEAPSGTMWWLFYNRFFLSLWN